MINIREVAKRAGVGIGTVSRVLNGHPSVRPEVRQRVLDVVKQLDYVPNVHAQRMWKHRANTICFLLSNRDLLLSLHGHIFRGVEQFCAINGYSVLFSAFHYSPHTPASKLELPAILKTRGIVDGVTLGGVNYPNLVERIRSEGIPYSVFGNNFVDESDPASNAIMFDDRTGAEQAVEYLIQLGHRDIWFVGDVDWPWNRRRYERFRAIMKLHGYEGGAITTGLARAGHELGLRAAPAILETSCTAVFAASDYIACGVIEAAQQAGRKIPGDLSVIGFDALDEFVYYRPAITTVGTDKEKVGEHCALLLLKQIDGSAAGVQPNVTLPMRLAERDSCAPIAYSRGGAANARPRPRKHLVRSES
jgi:LacI family transcriptional regulator